MISKRIKLFLGDLTTFQNKTRLTEIQKYPVLKNVKFIMCDIQSKITRYAKKQQNKTHYEHKNRPIETDPELTQISDLADNDIKHYYHYITYI